MTTVIGCAVNGVVHMASDSLSSTEDIHQECTMPKIFKLGQFLIGIAGSWEGTNYLKYKMNLAKINKTSIKQDVYGKVYELFYDHKDKLDKDLEVLIGLSGRLFQWTDGVLTENKDGVEAIGSGYMYALGSFYTQYDRPSDSDIETDLITAIKAATYYDPRTGGDIQYMNSLEG